METTRLLQATNDGSPRPREAAAATAATTGTAAAGDHAPIMVSPAVLANHLCSNAPQCDRDMRAFERVIRETMESKDRSEAELFDEWVKHRTLTARVEEARDREEERAARVAMLLADGRILSTCGQGNLLLEIVLKAEGDERTEDGAFPAACGAIHKLMGTKGVPGAMTAAGYIISLAVGWRMIEVVRPTVAGELASGYFFISDLRELVRKAFGLRLCFEQGGKGDLTPVKARLTLKADSGVDFFRVVDEAAQRGAERRLQSKVRRYQLAAYYHRREPRDAQGHIVGLDAALALQQRQHERAAEGAAGGSYAGLPGYSVVVGEMPIAQMLLDGDGGAPAAAAAAGPALRLTEDDVSESLEGVAEEQQLAATYALRKRAAAAATTPAATSDDDEQPPPVRRRRNGAAAAADALPPLQAVKTGGGTSSPRRPTAAPVTPLLGNANAAATVLSDNESLEVLFAASREKYCDTLALECVSGEEFEEWRGLGFRV